jgi:enediyne biosynthesis protein E4
MRIVCTLLLFTCLEGMSQPLFTLVPEKQTGIRFQNNITESATQNVLAYEYFYNGGGVATGDLNHDGLADIVFTANMDQPKIYFNKGNLHFEDVSTKSKVRASGWKTGVTLADVNADGWLDIYICRSGNGEDAERSNLLFINQKNGSFTEMGAQYGVDDKGHSTQAAFFDYDNDGDLDLFVLNHSTKRYRNFDVAWMKSARDPLAGDKLFRNDNGHYADVSADAGIIGNPICFGLGVAIADFNRDGWPDMYVTNDYDEDDYLYINQHDGTFKESVSSYLGHTSKFSMGCDVGDINNDGMSDLITLDMLPEDNRRQKLLKGPDGYDFFQMLLSNGYYYQYMRNMLHLATKYNDKVEFREIGQLAGISNTDWSWSALFADYDLDGWQDLFITNGYMRDYTNLDYLKYIVPEEIKKARAAGTEPDLYGMVLKMPSSGVKNYLYRNKGDLSFENVSQQWGMDMVSLSHGAAYADLDNDGDLDLVVNNTNKNAFVWQNHAEDKKNNYLKIQLTGNGGNTFGMGAKVIVSAADGFQQLQEMETTHGFQSSMEPCLFYGLGKRNTVEVKVCWPNGKTQVISNQPVNLLLQLDQKNATADIPKEKIPTPLFTETAIDKPGFIHIENAYNDFKKEPLLPHQFAKNGPALAAGDVNGDGRPDFFAGGAKGQPGGVFINQGNGAFAEIDNPVFAAHTAFEQVAAVFADLDNDKDLDLYVVSGGNEAAFEDHVYWNDGKGNFSIKENSLPLTASSGEAVAVFDMDGDGDLDIVRGGQVKTGAYPQAPASYLFENDHGIFKDVTPAVLKNIGMVSSIAAADINKDGVQDLVLAGEYMPVTVLYGEGKAPYFSQLAVIPHSSGWWNSITLEDIDNDGDIDIIGGNHGLNSQMKASADQPVSIDAADIDNNGSVDAVTSYFIQGKSYPMPSRDELLDQVPSLKGRFSSYKAYADAAVNSIFSEDQLKKALHLEAEEFRSGLFINNKGSFSFAPFANEAQVFPVRACLVADYNHDGFKDILLAGNNFAVRAQSGRYDAGKGLLLVQQKQGDFMPLSNTGFHAAKDARRMIVMDNFIIVGNNNDAIQVFKIN